MNRWNDIPYDVLEAFCQETATLPNNSASSRAPNEARKSLLALSLVDSRTREACYPWLFKKVTFNNTRPNSPSWKAFDEGMKLMVKNPPLCRAIKTFQLYGYVLDVKKNCPSPTTYKLLPTFLASLPQLHTLTFLIQDPFVPKFRSAFAHLLRTCGPWLTIENLAISRNCAFLINHCPNILELEETSLYKDKVVKFVAITEPLGTSRRRLRTLSTAEAISSNTLQDILKSLPLLKELKFSGDLSEDQSNQQGIMKFLPEFAHFAHLHRLILPNSSTLGIGFNPPWCMPHTPSLLKRVKREGQEAAERVARGVQAVCPGVSELWIGVICFKRDGKGVMVCSNLEKD
ncbi:hypothetical protein JAAARDRAFT_35550 [Jaapia argillacea MUCL 33604]|uniref:F-box domain-containing protein n=1 Tax=Jaapia argillacea MUCL 33604 TaxID=933084 RepID=A0A067Q0F2_9AGAM|nr:hypothetical protein JAAARDRAFT_35550 [Jaapia argillacea MUCL 33604]